jgi:hypothetical protein
MVLVRDSQVFQSDVGRIDADWPLEDSVALHFVFDAVDQGTALVKCSLSLNVLSELRSEFCLSIEVSLVGIQPVSGLSKRPGTAGATGVLAQVEWLILVKVRLFPRVVARAGWVPCRK